MLLSQEAGLLHLTERAILPKTIARHSHERHAYSPSSHSTNCSGSTSRALANLRMVFMVG